MAQKSEVLISTDIFMKVWYNRNTLTWIGEYRNRHTGDQIGHSWWGATRDHVLVFSPNVSDA